MKKKMMGIAIGLWALLFMPMYASAVTFNVAGGKLLGANDINVNGQFYNVEFIDGTCVSIFGGCGSTSDFDFQTMEAANAASQALLDQVLINVPQGSFDDHPELTSGINYLYMASLYTPYEVRAENGTVVVTEATNYWGNWNHLDAVTSGVVISPYTNTANNTESVYVRWYQVPEAPTFVLLACGLAGLLLFARRQRKRQEGLTF